MLPRAPFVLALSLSLAPCLAGPQFAMAAPAAQQVTAPAAEAGQRLNAMFEQYFEEYLVLNPLVATQLGDNRYNDRLPNYIGPEYRAQAHEMNERYLAAVQEFDPARLSGEDRISYEIFLSERLRQRESERFPGYLLPLAQTGGLPTMMPALGSGTNAQPFVTVADYENWLKRLDGFVVFMDQAIVNMREGVAKGVVQPRPVMEKVAVATRRHDRDEGRGQPVLRTGREVPGHGAGRGPGAADGRLQGGHRRPGHACLPSGSRLRP